MQVPPISITTPETSVELPASSAPSAMPTLPIINFGKLIIGANAPVTLDAKNIKPVEIKPKVETDQSSVDESKPIEINMLFNQFQLLTQARLSVDAPQNPDVQQQLINTTDVTAAGLLSPPSSLPIIKLPHQSPKLTEEVNPNNAVAMPGVNLPVDKLLGEDDQKVLNKFIKVKPLAAEKPEVIPPHVVAKHVQAPLPLDMNTVTPSLVPVTTTHLNIENQQNNKHVLALMQMGEIINSHTQQLAQALPQHSEISETDYVSTAKKVASADYETKIELHPETLDSMLNTTYNANIKIYPPELGHVLAKLKVDKNNSAELLIMTENNAVKQIVEANLTQLRDNFQQADINLSSIQVVTTQSQGKSPEQGGNSQNNHPVMNDNSQTAVELSTTTEKAAARQLNSLVDTYA